MIIGISGKARSGKDTVADALVSKRNYTRVAMADQMKTAVALLFGWNSEHTYGRLKEVVDDFWGMTPRQVMQKFGTEAMRGTFGDQFWCRAIERQLVERAKWEGKMRDYVIPDIRFPSEVEMVKRLGGQVWRLERLDGRPESTGEQHPSETALDDYKGFDWVIKAKTGVPELQALALDVLKHSADEYRHIGNVIHLNGEARHKDA